MTVRAMGRYYIGLDGGVRNGEGKRVYPSKVEHILNAHDQLVTALRDVLNMHTMPTEPRTYRDCTDAMERARAALAKAAA